MRNSFAVECPSCRKALLVVLGRSECPSCGQKILIDPPVQVKRRYGKVVALAGLLVFLGVCTVFTKIEDHTSSDYGKAIEKAQRAVLREIENPGSAEFPNVFEKRYTVIGDDFGNLVVSAWVDQTTSRGTFRKYWKVEMRRDAAGFDVKKVTVE